MSEHCAEPLQDYRLYLLDSDGRIRTTRDLQAASDETAIWMTTNLGLSEQAELWQRGRRISAFDVFGALRA